MLKRKVINTWLQAVQLSGQISDLCAELGGGVIQPCVMMPKGCSASVMSTKGCLTI